MKNWDARPRELAFLFNPAFCGECLLRYLEKYKEYDGQGSPYSLIFLVLPVVLHKDTRERINPQTRKGFHRWIQENAPARAGFGDRAEALVGFTQEALSFLAANGMITLERQGPGIVAAGSYSRIPSTHFDNREISDIYRKSEILGRWYARAGGPVNVWSLWGVRP